MIETITENRTAVCYQDNIAIERTISLLQKFKYLLFDSFF